MKIEGGETNLDARGGKSPYFAGDKQNTDINT